MKRIQLLSLLIATAFAIVWISCSTNAGSLPDKPKSVAAVKELVNGKKYVTTHTGFYGNLTVNGKTEVAWIDAKKEKENHAKKAAEEQKSFSIHFLNDTAATVFIADTTFNAAYTLDDEVGEYDDKREGVKLRLSYIDPKFSFGGQLTTMTFTYIIDGINEKSLLLQLPQTINRGRLISLLKAE